MINGGQGITVKKDKMMMKKEKNETQLFICRYIY
jgi:hypothetical protein